MADISSPWPLFGLADDSRPTLRRILENGECAALATISALGGGGPRPVGTQMVIGRSEVSGFPLRWLPRSRCRRSCPVGSRKWPCAQAGVRRGKPLARHSPDVRGQDRDPAGADRPSRHRYPRAFRAYGSTPAGSLDQRWRQAGLRFARSPTAILAGRSRKGLRAVSPPHRYRGRPTALAIAALGGQAGYQTTLVRPKGPPGAAPFEAVAYSRDEPDAALTAIGLDAWTAVAVATHDAELDHAALMVALPSEAFYIGALGARRRLPERLAQLRAEEWGSIHLSPTRADWPGHWRQGPLGGSDRHAWRDHCPTRRASPSDGAYRRDSHFRFRAIFDPASIGKEARASSSAKTSRTLRAGPSSTRK